MPTVPIARPVSTVQAPIRGGEITTNASPDVFGAGIGRGIQNVASAGQSTYDDHRKSINEAAVLEADTVDAQHDLAARTALREARGKDAGKVYGDLVDARTQQQGEIERKLSNPMQREAYRRRSAARLQDFQGWGSGHVAAESDRYNDQVAEASLTTGMERVAASRDDWNQAASILDETVNNYRSYASRRGIPPEAQSAKEAQIRSGGIRTVVEGLVQDQNDLAATRLVKEHGNLLLDDDRKAVTKLLEISNRDGTAQRIVDQYVVRGKLDEVGLQRLLLGEAPSEARDVADEIKRLENSNDPADISRLQSLRAYAAQPDKGPVKAPAWVTAAMADTKLRDEVQSRALQAINIRENAKKAVEYDAYTKAYQVIQDPAKSYSDIPADIKATLEKRPDLDLHLRQLAAKTERVTTTDRATYYQLQAEAVADPTAFGARNLMDYATKLSDGDFKEMVKLQAEAKKGAGENLSWLTSREDVVNEALAGLKIDPRTYVTKDGETTPNEAAIGFRRAVEQEANAVAQGNKHPKPTIDDVRKASDNVLLKRVRLNEYGRDPEAVAATVSKDQRGAAYVPIDQIEGGKVDAVRQLIQAAGGEATDDRIQRAYAARLMNDRVLFDQILKER